MRRLLLSSVILALGLASAACSGSDDPDSGVMYEEPQIVPDRSPVCISLMTPTQVGQSTTRGVVLRNEGRQNLEISGGAFTEEDRAGSFVLSGISPMSVESFQSAVAQVVYTPTAPGWDYAILRVRSNAQNYPNLDLFILALGVPPGLDGGMFDAGPKPAAALQGGMEACSNADGGGF